MLRAPVAGLPDDFKEGTPLPPALFGDKEQLSEAAQNEIESFKGANPYGFLWTLISAWLVIIALIIIARYVDNFIISIFAIYGIATRQQVLALLVHEQAHGLGFGFRSKWGNLVANLFCAMPLLFLSVENYARTHLAHHKYFFTEHDPDFIRKNGRDWTFPMRTRHFLWLFVSDIFGANISRAIAGEKIHNRVLKQNPTNESPSSLSPLVRMLYFGFFAGLFTYFHLWGVFLLYFVVPLLTFFQLFLRWGAIDEHKYNVVSQNIIDSTPIITISRLERLLLPNLNFNYHIYHHYYPYISFVHLPKVHAIYEREGLVHEKNIFHGYFSFIKYLQWGKQS